MSTATRSRRRSRARQAPPANGGGAHPPAHGAPQPNGPVTPRLRAQTGSLGVVRVQQLVLIQVAIALVLVGLAVHLIVAALMTILGAGLLIAALGRWRQIPLPDWFATVRAMKRRRQAITPVPPGVESAFAPIVECDPSLRTYEYMDREGRPVGFVGDGTFLTALVQVEAEDEPLRPARGSRTVPLDLLHSALEIEDIRLESAQFLQYTQPAPAPHLPERAVAAISYAPIQAQTQTPAVQMTWIALKLDPELCPEAVEARGGDLGGAQRSLLRAADQLVSRLSGLGLDARVLEERDLVNALGIAVCASPRANVVAGRDNQTRRRTEEAARAWRCDDRWHTTYWVRGWPQLGVGAAPLAGVAQLLSGSRAMASVFSLTATRGTHNAHAFAGHLRLACRSENELEAAQQELEGRARSAKAGLVRLDREQLPGLLATLPLGGTR
ncbi:type VII secretion protein EccE [Streptomyces sp. XM4193]|uniref:type VII secretion protein EccE n=1 Tax=Streptomyces sp. XM4193 TaxID=2929782 RepID=UPI001FF97960|nr:type VII secretion protein EccE [Streptomyces sp. XM4193]MCK1798891.1 type VII secretion protein EccE [Streptomyces sp. XM4193]